VVENYIGVNQNPVYRGFDPLSSFVSEGHKAGLRVHAWFEFGFSYAYKDSSLNGWLQKYPHWAGKDKNHLLLNFITPIFSWIPSIGVSNLLVINNTTELIRWNENLIVSSLKDQSLYRLLLDKKNSVYLVERVNIGIRIRDLLQIGDLIYLLEDSDTPSIWKLSVKKKPLP
jgi:hypothetical protein